MRDKSKEKGLENQGFYQLLQENPELGIVELMQRFMASMINRALEIEVSEYIGRERYQRRKQSPEAYDSYRNGYQDYTVRTQLGKVKVKKPRLRKYLDKYYSKILERIKELEENLHKIILESHVRGLSTRDIEKTFTDSNGEKLLSKSGASALNKQLYDDYLEFSKQDLSQYDVVYLFVDGVYEAVKQYTNNQAILCAWGITSSGEKILLGLSAASSESYDSCHTFFEEMKNRGLRNPLLIISDGGKGLNGAISACFPESDRQRCITHKMRNICSKVPEEAKEEIKKQVQSVYYAADTETARILANNIVNQYSSKYPSMVKCLMDDFDSCIKHLEYPAIHHRFIRTTNLIERTFVEQKRRTKVMGQHNSERSAIGLVFAVLYRSSKDWRKIKMSEFELTVLKNIKKFKKIRKNENENDYISWTA